MAIHGHPRWLSCCSGFVGALFLCLHLSEQLDTLRFAPVLEAKYIYNIYIYNFEKQSSKLDPIFYVQ